MQTEAVTVGDHTATYPTGVDAMLALFAALPRKQRNVLWWMETLRGINQDEAGVKRVGKPESDAKAVAGAKG